MLIVKGEESKDNTTSNVAMRKFIASMSSRDNTIRHEVAIYVGPTSYTASDPYAYQDLMLDIYRHDDIEEITNVLKRQDILRRSSDAPTRLPVLLVLDTDIYLKDVGDLPKYMYAEYIQQQISSDPLLKKLLFNHRHYNIDLFIITRPGVYLKPAFRMQFDCVTLMPEVSIRKLRHLTGDFHIEKIKDHNILAMLKSSAPIVIDVCAAKICHAKHLVDGQFNGDEWTGYSYSRSVFDGPTLDFVTTMTAVTKVSEDWDAEVPM